MTITDEMLNNAHRAYHSIPLLPDDEITDFDRERMRSAIAVARAVMPAPTDAEFEAAVEAYADARTHCSSTISIGTLFNREDHEERVEDALDKKRAARRTLLAMHAWAGDRKLRELRAWLSEQIDDDASAAEDEWSQGVNWTARAAIREIDAMLGGSRE